MGLPPTRSQDRGPHSTSSAPRILSANPRLSSLDHYTYTHTHTHTQRLPFLLGTPVGSFPLHPTFTFSPFWQRLSTSTNRPVRGSPRNDTPHRLPRDHLKVPPVFLSCKLLVEAFFFICIYLIFSHPVSSRALSFPVVRTQFCAPEGD